jgi:hypothetical protein
MFSRKKTYLLFGTTKQRVYRVPGFLSSRPNWLPPPPHPQSSIWFPGGGGGVHSLAVERVGEPIRTKERHSGTQGIVYPSTLVNHKKTKVLNVVVYTFLIIFCCCMD